MTPEQINRILELKRMRLSFIMTLSHYLAAILMTVFACLFFYLFICVDDEYLLLFSSVMWIIPALTLFLLGRKQLKLRKIPIQFPDNNSAYIKSKIVFSDLKWDIIEENGTNYIKALRKNSLFGGQIDNRGKAISIFIEQGYVYAISLYHPLSRAEFFGVNSKNTKLFEKKIREITIHDE